MNVSVLGIGQSLSGDELSSVLATGEARRAHVLQVGPVILPHDEKLAAVAEHGGPDA